MEADCPICAAVAVGGRIRVTKEGAALLIALLKTARRNGLQARRAAIETGDAAARQDADQILNETEMIRSEVARTQIEKGWRHGQPQSPDT